ncbi:hypothetical protein [Chryseobacterium sp. POE27]|uniref:hypothetical protein n=1 Tax=Chryseobacterium sp. POE27 TaxID=3138177 RepID=UPI00321C0A76
MEVESFLKIVEEIEHSCLSAEQQEEMITKVADLSRFIQSYDPSIEIINWMRYKGSIIKYSGTNTGVIFCDDTKLPLTRANYSNAGLIDFKKRENLKELWLVVVSSCASNDLRSFKSLITDKSRDKIYDKIFSFDFLQSRVQIIK